MPSQRLRTVLIIAAAAVLLAVAAACAPEFKHDLSTPQAAVRTYLGYLSQADGASAYEIMTTDAKSRCSRDYYIGGPGAPMVNWVDEMESARVVLLNTRILDSSATVRASVNPGRVDVGLLGPRPSSLETDYTLELEGNEWKVSNAGWPYVYCDFAKPAEPAATPAANPEKVP